MSNYNTGEKGDKRPFSPWVKSTMSMSERIGANGLTDREHDQKFTKALKREHGKVSKVMGEYKRGKLHSGSKKGPEVTSKAQALAIALSEARKGKK